MEKQITQFSQKRNTKVIYLLPIFLFSFISINKAQNTNTFSVVELFTSEGCSSCPGADNMMNSTVNAQDNSSTNNLYIALHVELWNYLGWTDSYSNPQYDNMFFGYGNNGNGITYTNGASFGTPLFVKNGSEGRNYSTTAVTKTATAWVDMTFQELIGNQLKVNYVLTGDLINTELRFFLVERGLVKNITSGENSGLTLHHENVARDMEILSTTESNGTVTFTVPTNADMEKMRVMAYIQKVENSPWSRDIIGANKGFKLGDFVGITEIKNMIETDMYPNPSNSSTSILCVEKMEQVTIIDDLGKVVFSMKPFSNQIDIDISPFEKGIYFVQIETSKGLVKNKLIKY